MTQREQIIREMRVMPTIDPDFEIKRRVNFIKNSLLSSKLKILVLGISGGIDSCTCGRLAQIAIDELNKEHVGEDYTFIAVRLPYGEQADEGDAQLSVDFIKPSKCITINVKPGSDAIHNEVINAVSDIQSFDSNGDELDFAKGNAKARVRMVSQYFVAGLMGGLVLGTDHSAENITGFFTKYGDGAVDLIPLFGLNKRQVRQLAAKLGTPQHLIDKAPTADLECNDPGKEDEQALGVTYDQIDDFLEGREIDQWIVDKLINIYNSTQHKRKAIPTLYED